MLYLSPLWNIFKSTPNPPTPSLESLLRVPNELLENEQKELQRSFENDFHCKKLSTNKSEPLSKLEATMALEVVFWTCLFKLIKLKVLPYKMFYNALKFGDSSIACKIIGNNIEMLELIKKDCDAKKVKIQKSESFREDRGFLIKPVFIHKVVEEIMKGRKEEKKELTYEEDLKQIVATINKNSRRAENNVKKESDASTQTEANEGGSSDSKENPKNKGDKVYDCAAPMGENSEEKTDSKAEKLRRDEATDKLTNDPVAQMNKAHALKMAKMIAEHNEEMRVMELEGNARSRERREEWRRIEEKIIKIQRKCKLASKHHLDECKDEWEAYLNTVRGPVEAFQSQVNKIKYRRDHDTSQETFRKQLHNIWNHGYTAYHHLVQNFDYLKGVSEQHPDKLFLRILMSKMSAMATAFCSLIDSFEDQSSRSTLFDQIDPSDIPSTGALQKMCATANAHDYDVILPPKTLKSGVEIVDLNEEVESDL